MSSGSQGNQHVSGVVRKLYMRLLYASAFALLTSLALSGLLRAQDVVILTDDEEHASLGLHLELLEDEGGTLTIADVTSPEYAEEFVTSERERPSFGFSANHRSAVMYSLAHDFCAPGSMHMASLGWPRQHRSATGFGNNEVHESVLKKAFTGQGMSLPCLTTCLCAYVLNRRGPWWKQ